MFGRSSSVGEALAKTRRLLRGRIRGALGSGEITDDTWEELEALLVQADLGVETTLEVVAELQQQARQAGWTRTDELAQGLHAALRARLDAAGALARNPDGLTVVLVVGVNGSGKTTTAAKLGKLFQAQGLQVVLAAADTYRAAATEQLQSWGERLGLRVVAGQAGADPGAVTYDAVTSAAARKADLLLVDTAGRLHTRYNLMEELKKVERVAGKALPGAPHAVWLVMDATTGQNALQQARAFKEAVGVTGVILAKLDSSARGGMAFAIQRELGLPILYAGLGEQPEDLQPFDADEFIEGVLGDFVS